MNSPIKTLHLKKGLLLIAMITLVSCAYSKKPTLQPIAEQVELIEWSSDASAARFSKSDYKVDFFPLSNNYVSQDNGFVCGPASAAMVLNTLKLRRSEDLPFDESSISKSERKYIPKKYNPFFRKYTQNNVFNKNTKQKIEILGRPVPIKGEKKKDYGFQLRQLAQLLQSNNVSVNVRVVSDDIPDSAVTLEI
jgi:hypothetical protein